MKVKYMKESKTLGYVISGMAVVCVPLFLMYCFGSFREGFSAIFFHILLSVLFILIFVYLFRHVSRYVDLNKMKRFKAVGICLTALLAFNLFYPTVKDLFYVSHPLSAQLTNVNVDKKTDLIFQTTYRLDGTDTNEQVYSFQIDEKTYQSLVEDQKTLSVLYLPNTETLISVY